MKVKFKELNSGYEGVGRVSRFSKKTKMQMTVALVLVAAFVFVYILSSVGLVPLDALAARCSAFISRDSENFPLEINSDSTVNVKSYGGGIIVLSAQQFSVYSSKGKQVLSQSYNFASPTVSVNGDKAVVFDRGEVGYYLIDNGKITAEGETSGKLICAEYGESGDYAFGTRASSATSMLTVYSATGKVRFQWNCAYEHITAIALSSNGNFAGVAAMGAENGEIFTSVKYFGFDYSEPINSQTVNGAAAFDIVFTSKNLLTLFTDCGVYAIDKSSETPQTVTEFYSAEFNSFDVSDRGDYVVALAEYGSADNFKIAVYSGKGKPKVEIELEGAVGTVRMSDKYIFALAENAISVYNLNGRKISGIQLEGEVESLYPTDKYIFIGSLNKISRCYSYGNFSVDITGGFEH